MSRLWLVLSEPKANKQFVFTWSELQAVNGENYWFRTKLCPSFGSTQKPSKEKKRKTTVKAAGLSDVNELKWNLRVESDGADGPLNAGNESRRLVLSREREEWKQKTGLMQRSETAGQEAGESQMRKAVITVLQVFIALVAAWISRRVCRRDTALRQQLFLGGFLTLRVTVTCTHRHNSFHLHCILSALLKDTEAQRGHVLIDDCFTVTLHVQLFF